MLDESGKCFTTSESLPQVSGNNKELKIEKPIHSIDFVLVSFLLTLKVTSPTKLFIVIK